MVVWVVWMGSEAVFHSSATGSYVSVLNREGIISVHMEFIPLWLYDFTGGWSLLFTSPGCFGYDSYKLTLVGLSANRMRSIPVMAGNLSFRTQISIRLNLIHTVPGDHVFKLYRFIIERLARLLSDLRRKLGLTA